MAKALRTGQQQRVSIPRDDQLLLDRIENAPSRSAVVGPAPRRVGAQQGPGYQQVAVAGIVGIVDAARIGRGAGRIAPAQQRILALQHAGRPAPQGVKAVAVIGRHRKQHAVTLSLGVGDAVVAAVDHPTVAHEALPEFLPQSRVEGRFPRRFAGAEQGEQRAHQVRGIQPGPRIHCSHCACWRRLRRSNSRYSSQAARVTTTSTPMAQYQGLLDSHRRSVFTGWSGSPTT